MPRCDGAKVPGCDGAKVPERDVPKCQSATCQSAKVHGGTPAPWHPCTVAPSHGGTVAPWHPRTVAPGPRGPVIRRKRPAYEPPLIAMTILTPLGVAGGVVATC